MELFFILLALSFPVFYIYGLISLIRDLRKRSMTMDTPGSDKKTLLQGIISELQAKVSENPNKTAKELLSEYKERFEKLYGTTTASQPLVASVPQTVRLQKQAEPQEDFLAKWYSNNSINLLLYIGAFLIVSSAGIFVSFQWETISGVAKSLLLTLVGGAFFGCGWYFYGVPKIKNAGTTFIGIAAILIPVIGSAWYTFVLKDAGVPVGVAWLLTSAVAMLAYVSLALYMRGPFYAYASTITTFSLMLAVVNTMELHQNFYLLASIIACFILLLATATLKKLHPIASEVFTTPTNISSQIAMPITLVYGFIIAVSDNKLFSTEAVLSIFLASLFYLVSYALTKVTVNLSVSQMLFLVTVYLAGNWLSLSETTMYYAIGGVTLLYCGLGYYFSSQKLAEEADSSFVISVISGIILFIIGMGTNLAPVSLVILTIFPIVTSGFVAWYKKNPYPLLVTSAFFSIAVYIIYMQILKYDKYPEYLGLLYLVHGVGRYILTFSLNRKLETQQVGHITVVSYSLVALLLSWESSWILIICTSVIAFMLFCTSILQKIPHVSYLGTFFAFASVFIFFDEINTPQAMYPFIIFLFACVVFAASRVAKDHLSEELRHASLLTSSFSSLYFFFTGQLGSNNNELQQNALISTYGTTILFGVDYLVNQIKNFGYVTSFIGMGTLLWQIYYLGFTDSLMYTTPLGLYFLILAYTRKLQKDLENERALTIVGILLLLLPPFFLSFGDDAMKYSVILGVEGIIMVVSGISLGNIFLRYAGVAGIVLAILPQTYSYILALPRWLIIGALGLLFLSFAIFLLLKRKEEG